MPEPIEAGRTTTTSQPDRSVPGSTTALTSTTAIPLVDELATDSGAATIGVTPSCLPPDDAPINDPHVTAVVDPFLTDPRLAPHQVAISIATWNPATQTAETLYLRAADDLLLPASNQKLATAASALSTLDPQFTFATRAVGDSLPQDGVLHGPLVLVGGGDPTLTRSGPHSLDEVATQVAAAGITQIDGDLVIDDSRHAQTTSAPGWQPWQQPTYVGYLSALIVDENRSQAGAPTTDVALANGSMFGAALADQGVTLTGVVRRGTTPSPAYVWAEVQSPPLSELITAMLTESDNLVSEQLLREIGLATAGEGSHLHGTATIANLLESLCLPAGGIIADGSGLSRWNQQSARGWTSLLDAARIQPWGETFRASLAVAGQTGTLRNRLPGLGSHIVAKTGSTIPARSLSGYLTTRAGQQLTFSIVVNGTEPPIDAERAIDAIVTALVELPLSAPD